MLTISQSNKKEYIGKDLVLAIGGMFGSRIFIGIPCAMIASACNKYKTGKSNTNPNIFKFMANIAIICLLERPILWYIV